MSLPPFSALSCVIYVMHCFDVPYCAMFYFCSVGVLTALTLLVSMVVYMPLNSEILHVI